MNELDDHPSSYLSPKLEGRVFPEKGGHGAFARELIQAGEVISVWGGKAMTRAEVARLNNPAITTLAVQIDEDIFLVTTKEGPGDWVNHSCEPNAGLQGQVTLVAMRDIQPGEEVCFDYAMTDGSVYDEFTCACGSPKCRGYVSGNDWQIPELWERYNGYFSPYLQKRIERLREEATVSAV
ncbi:MAG: SET domain-containing protein-lysine N-methyltransferase [Chloroflexota bacterium]|nr:SET domain-containing protein-lysine N-methyltransferase [Chloroflexota bacterium]NOG62956.1 SET domain-containing protein [Chloroflexota bacterium]GIK63613.1 MAG: SET domain-containing protein-lysine N-methyltransferase [Chloroflexota bacterium]